MENMLKPIDRWHSFNCNYCHMEIVTEGKERRTFCAHNPRPTLTLRGMKNAVEKPVR